MQKLNTWPGEEEFPQTRTFTYILTAFPVFQAHVQTNEDNLCDEVQTDEIKYKNKWTQKPVSFQTKNSSVDDVTLFSQVIFVT